MTCTKCILDAAVAEEEAAVAAEQQNAAPTHDEQDIQNNQVHDHNEDPYADTNEDETAEEEKDREKSSNGGENGDDENDDENDGSDGNNRWSKSGRRFKSTDEAIVRGDKDKNNPGSYLWVRPKLFSRMARHQLGRLLHYLNLHKFSEIQRLAKKLNLPRRPTQQQIRERNRALGGLIAGLRHFEQEYAEVITEHNSATLPETNRVLLACYLIAGYEENDCNSLERRMYEIKKLRNEKFRSLFPITEDVRVYDLMLKKLADRLRDEQEKGTIICIQLLRNYSLDAYDEACQEVKKQDADKKNDNNNSKEPVGTGSNEIEFVELDDKDTNSGFDMGAEFPPSQSTEGERLPNPASIVRVLEPLFPTEVQEQLASLAFAFNLHDNRWLDQLLRLDETALNRLAAELGNLCNNACKNGWGTKTGHAFLSCLQGVQSEDACAFLRTWLRDENCHLRRTLYRSLFPITTVKSLYDDSLMFLDMALEKCKEDKEVITVPLLRKLAIESHQKAQELHNEKRRQQEEARKQKDLRQKEKRLKAAKAAGKRNAADSKTPPAATNGKRKGRKVTASTGNKAGATKSATSKKKPARKKKTAGTKRAAANTVDSSNDSDDGAAVNSRASRALPFSASPSFTDSRKRTQAVTQALIQAMKLKYPGAGIKDILPALDCDMEPIKFMDIVRDQRIQRSGLTPENVRDMIKANLDPIQTVEALKQKYPDAGIEDILLALDCGKNPVEFMDIVRDEQIRGCGLTRENVRNLIKNNLDPIEVVEALQENPNDDPDDNKEN